MEVNSEDIHKLLELFSNSSFKPKDSDKAAELIQQNCVQLFTKDYPDLAVIANEHGELSTAYPSKIIVPFKASESSSNGSAQNGSQSGDGHPENGSGGGRAVNIEANKLRELMTKARVARCRARFPVPVIYVDGKYVCRSATLSGGAEIYGRSGLDMLFAHSAEEEESSATATFHGSPINGSSHGQPALPSLSSLSLSDSSQVFSKVRNQDIQLLKYLSVKYICDLMVEKKKVKFGFNITSSEKADKEGRYSDFELLSLPYPGCEFFRDYRDKGYQGEGLLFDWSQHFVDASLVIPNSPELMQINWTKYKSWDIIKLTQNYLKLLFHYLSNSDSSVLVHCISGWDRTPLFISLLRLSLWADGKVHQNLSATEITYLTVAYDWFLFGHNLNDRISKGEEILFFCFSFLKFIASEEYSIDNFKVKKRYSESCRKDSSAKRVDGNLEDSLMEESAITIKNSPYMGSCTSLNSTCSIGSVKSHDLPPAYFPCNQDVSFCCVDSAYDVPDGVCVRTPPTLTNSKDSEAFLNSIDDADSSIETLVSFGNNYPKKLIATNDHYVQKYSPPSNKSTPVAIPMQSAGRTSGRGRGTSLDGWQLVSETGSVRETTSARGFYSSPEVGSEDSSSSNRSTNGANKPESNGSPLSSKSRSDSRHNSVTRKNHRKQRLQDVRSIFYNAYSSVVGFRFKNGNESSGVNALSSLFFGAGTISGRITAPH
ncbi:Myotubularin-related protein 14 [Halotydeus destructor]|nr:Myotubularin-related protein 14 [Halotydeus destructor]